MQINKENIYLIIIIPFIAIGIALLPGYIQKEPIRNDIYNRCDNNIIEKIRFRCDGYDFYYETGDKLCKELWIYDDIELSLKEQGKYLLQIYTGN